MVTALAQKVRDRHQATRGATARLDRGWATLSGLALVALPVLVLVVLAWSRRWMADDAYIHLRVVSQLLAGHGPVFNTGHRVEVSTSPAWVGILAAAKLVVPWVALPWLAVVLALALTTWALVAAQWGALRLAGWRPGTGLAVPLGAIAVAAIPAFWDFGTSGMEVGLELAWLATSFLGLAYLVTPRDEATPRRVPLWVAGVAGLGVLIHPDLALFSVGFLVVIVTWQWRHGEGRWHGLVAPIVAFAALPVAYQVFRMGYYGAIEPNTALAKSAFLAYWSQGLVYLGDFVLPYQLWVPILAILVLVVWLALRLRARGQGDAALLTIALAITAIAYTVWVVRFGGGFMHARFLIPPFFALLLPVAAAPLTRRHGLVALALVVWAIPCAAFLRTPYHDVGPQGISNERQYWQKDTGSTHPVGLASWAGDPAVQEAHQAAALAQHNARVLLFWLPVPVGDELPVPKGHPVGVPLAPGVRVPVVATQIQIGAFSYAAGLNVSVDDGLGLANPVGSRLRLTHRGRPGHEKVLPPAWFFASYEAPSAPPLPALANPAQVAAARAALGCGALHQITEATTAPLTLGRFASNFFHAWHLSHVKVDPNPFHAERQMCG